MRALFANPEFLRLARSKLRPRQMLVLGGISALVLSMILGVWYWILIANNTYVRNSMMKNYFFVVVGLQMGVLSFYGLIQAAQSVTQEKERFTFEFQRLVAMGPHHLVLGKILGAPCEAWFMAGVGAVFAFLPVLSSDVPVVVYAFTMLVLVVVGLAVSTMGVFFSSIADKTQRASGLATAVPMLLFFVHIGIAAAGVPKLNVWAAMSPYIVLSQLSEAIVNTGANPCFYLYGIPVPLIAGFFAWMAFFAAFFYTVSVRRLQDEEYSFLSPWQAFAFFALLEILMLGDYAVGDPNPARAYPGGPPVFFHGANLGLLMLLAFALTPSGEMLRGRLHRARRDEHWKVLFEPPTRFQDAPAIFPMLVLCGAYCVFALLLCWSLGEFTRYALPTALMVAAMGLACAGLLLYIQAYLEKAGLRAGMLLVSVLLIVPPVVVGYFTYSWKKTVYINPVTYLSVIGHQDMFENSFRDAPGIGAVWTFPLVAIAAALLLPALSAMRIRYLIDLYAFEPEKERKLAEEKNAQAGPARTPQAAEAALARHVAASDPVPPPAPIPDLPPMVNDATVPPSESAPAATMPVSAPVTSASAGPKPAVPAKPKFEPYAVPPLVPEIKLSTEPKPEQKSSASNDAPPADPA